MVSLKENDAESNEGSLKNGAEVPVLFVCGVNAVRQSGTVKNPEVHVIVQFLHILPGN
jgi:hypothetical protein